MPEPTTPPVPTLSPIRMLWDVAYGTLETFTGTVGLSPLQVLAGIGVLLLVLVGGQLALALSGKSSWTLADLREQRQLDALDRRSDELLRELKGGS